MEKSYRGRFVEQLMASRDTKVKDFLHEPQLLPVIMEGGINRKEQEAKKKNSQLLLLHY